MTNKRKMHRARRIYGNLNVKKRRKELIRRTKLYFGPYYIPSMPTLLYDPFTCRFFTSKCELITETYHKISKYFEEYRSRVAKEFGEAT